MTDEKVFDFIRQLAVKYNAEKVVLFGSRARGDNFEKSDYDIVFYGINDSMSMIDIKEACDYESPTLKEIDVSFIQDMGENFLQSIKKDGIIIYERNKT